MKKIMYIIKSLELGGAEKLVLKLTETYHKENSIIILTRIEGGPIYDQVKNMENVTLVSLKIDSMSPFKNLTTFIRMIKYYKPDIIHTHLFWADRYGLILGALCGVKKRISTIHSMEPHDFFMQKVTRVLTAIFATDIITVSEAMKSYFPIYPSKKTTTIYNVPVLNLTINSHKNNIGEITRFISVGRLEEPKNQITLLKIFHKLSEKAPNIQLEIWGDGNERNTLEKYIADNKITNIFLRGFTNDVAGELRKSDIFISLSSWEGFGIAVIEAMSMGIPVIVSDIPSHREIVTIDGDEYPLLLDTNKIDECVDKILTLKNNSDLYNELSKRVELMSKIFSTDDFETLHSKVYFD